MTCIVAMVFNNEVFMAGDLMGSNGFTKKVYPDSKVFKNGDFVIGYTDSFRMGQILQYNWVQPPRIEGLTDRQFLQVDVIESMREAFNVYGYGSKEGREDIGGNFIIGYKGAIYEMQPNFSILKHEDFAAVGSGQYHAEASLALLSEEVATPEECVLALGKSIENAARFTTGVSGEYTWETTYTPSDGEVKEMLWEENTKVIDETLETLDIPQEDKDNFIKVRDHLDRILSSIGVPEELQGNRDSPTSAEASIEFEGDRDNYKVVYNASGLKEGYVRISEGERLFETLNGDVIPLYADRISDSKRTALYSILNAIYPETEFSRFDNDILRAKFIYIMDEILDGGE